ncbi:hypothetical protein GCM10022221_55770 [Actinocorallia aurea]
MSDHDRVLRHFDRMSHSDQKEVASDVDSFTSWLKAIKALADLIPYAIKLFKWIRGRIRR